MAWSPPFQLYHAGRQVVASTAYGNDVSRGHTPRRILVKHTLSGEGVLYVRKRRILLPAGHAFVIERPGPYRYGYEGDGTPWHFEYVSIRYTNPGGLLPPVLREDPVVALDKHADLREQLATLVDLRDREDYRMELAHSALAYRFFLNYIAARTGRTESGTSAPAERLRQLIDETAEDATTMAERAETLGYSQEAITRLFTARFEISPGQYLRQVRIRRACRLLEEPDLRIKEIAARTGYNDANYFARAFRQVMGVSPRQYRRNPDPLLAR